MSMTESSTPGDADILFGSLAKVQQKLFSYPPEGLLALTRDRRLVFVNRGGVLYDWPIDTIAGVYSPWYLLGEGLRCEVNGLKYWLYFNKLSSTARTGTLGGGSVVGDALALAGAVRGLMEIAGARGLCKNWKAVIAAAQQLPVPAH